MTKTETQIAEENIRSWEDHNKDKTGHFICFEHKATCQRFLDFLEDCRTFRHLLEGRKLDDQLLNKITDIQNAIKLYTEAGI